MAAAWNRNAADDGASNLWLCSSSSLRVALVVPRRRAGRRRRKCKHDGRNNGYDCFHTSALHELWWIVRLRSGLVEYDVNLRRSDRVGPRANRRNAAPECPLWARSRHLHGKTQCPLYSNSDRESGLSRKVMSALALKADMFRRSRVQAGKSHDPETRCGSAAQKR
jgi:hypothetical protein